LARTTSLRAAPDAQRYIIDVTNPHAGPDSPGSVVTHCVPYFAVYVAPNFCHSGHISGMLQSG